VDPENCRSEVGFMRYITAFCLLFLLVIDMYGIDPEWFSKAKSYIEYSEYFIRYQPKRGCYQSPNRAQGLRFSYYEDGFGVEPRVGGGWRIGVYVYEYGNWDCVVPFSCVDIQTFENRLVARGFGMDILYENSKRGLQQSFVVHSDPGGSELILGFHFEGKYKVFNDCVRFYDEAGKVIMVYGNISVHDADGKKLDWHFEDKDNCVYLIIEEVGVRYPIVIE